MKKNNVRFFSFFVFISLIFITIIITSCKLGLGETVDVMPPEISLNYPPTNSVIRDWFTVSGTASDDVGVKSVSIMFDSTEYSNKSYGPYEATINGSKYSLTANRFINNSYEIPDGKYEMKVVVTDATGRESFVSRTIIIDNTAPLLVLSQPSTVTGKDDSQQYGTKINIVGAIGETNSVNKLVLEAYSLDSSGTLVSKYESKEIFPQNLEHRIDIDSDFYRDLYPAGTTGGKSYKFKILVQDNACEYKKPGDTGTGNFSDGYIVDDEKFVDAGGTSYTTLEMYTMYNETYYTKEDGTIDPAKKAIADNTTAKLDDIRIDQVNTMGTFTIDPANAPKWELVGATGFASDVAVPEGKLTYTTTQSTITVKVSRGRDNTALSPDSFSVVIKERTDDGYATDDVKGFYPAFPSLIASDGSELNLSDEVIDARNDKLTASGTGYEISIKLDELMVLDETTGLLSTNFLSPGGYFLEVNGFDAADKEFNNETRYGFYIQGQEKPPEIQLTSPSTGKAYLSKDGTFSVGAMITSKISSTSSFSVELNDSDSNIDMFNISPKEIDTGVYSQELDFTGKAQGSYYFVLAAKEGEGSYSTKDIEIIHDTAAPTVDMRGISPIVDFDHDNNPDTPYIETVNGIITIKATIADDFDKIVEDEMYYSVNNGAKVALDNSRFEIDIDTTKLASPLVFKVFAKDRAGNVLEYQHPDIVIKQELDKPSVILSNAKMKKDDDSSFVDEDVAFGKNFFGLTANSVLQGTIDDDDGIESLEIAVYQGDTVPDNDSDDWKSIDVEEGTASASWRYDLAVKDKDAHNVEHYRYPEGIYNVIIRAKDTVYATSKNTNNKYESPVFAIGIVESKPTIKITTPEQNAYYSDDVKVSLVWTDSFAEDDETKPTITATNKVDGATASPITGNWDNDTWIENLSVGTTDNTRIYTITDRFGQKASTSFEYKVDVASPTITVVTDIATGTVVNLPTGKIITMDGTAADVGSSGLDELRYIVVDKDVNPFTTAEQKIPSDWASWTNSAGLGEWTANIDFTGKKDTDEHDIYVMIKDYAGNYSAPVKRTVKVDDTAPGITVLDSFAEGNTSGWNPTKFTMNVNDTVALDSYTVTLLDGTLVISDTLDGNTKEIALNSADLSLSEGRGTLVFAVKDKSGKIASQSMAYNMDSVSPILAVNNISDVDNFTSTSTTIFTAKDTDVSVTFSDDTSGAKGDGTVAYTLTKDGEAIATRSGNHSIAKNVTSQNFSIPLKEDDSELADGKWTLSITATDSAGKSTTIDSYFILDTTAPTVSVVTTPSTDAWNPSKYKATFGDTVELSSYSVKVQGSTSFIKKDQSLTGLSGSIELTEGTDFTLENGIGNLEFIVKDRSGKTSTSVVGYKKDNVEPTLTVSGIAKVEADVDPTTSFTSVTNKIYANFSDMDSGAKTITYSFTKDGGVEGTASNYSITEGIKTAALIIDLKDSTGNSLTDGIWTIKIAAKDVAENEKIVSRRFRLDTTSPEVEITAPETNDTLSLNSELTIEGTASDTMALDKVVVEIEYDDSIVKTTAVSVGDNGTWAWDITDADSPFAKNGTYEITARAYDKAGNSSYSRILVACDADAPRFNFTQPYAAEYNEDEVAVKNYIYATNQTQPTIGDIHLNVVANDFNMEEIWYQVGKNIAVEDTHGPITKITTTGEVAFTDGQVDKYDFLKGIWKKSENDANGTLAITIDTTKLVTFKEEVDSKDIVYIHIVGIDKAHNIGYAKYPIEIDDDLNKPIVQILSPVSNGGSTSVGGAFVVSGSATDNNGIEKIQMQLEVVDGRYEGNILKKEDGTEFSYDGAGTFKDRTEWYDISDKTGWSYVLNDLGQLNAIKDKLGDFIETFKDDGSPQLSEVIIRVRAVDITAEEVKSLVQEINVTIDGGSPSIIETTAGESVPQHNGFVSGHFPFSITVQDDNNIESVLFTANGVDVTDLFVKASESTDSSTDAKTHIWTGSDQDNDECLLCTGPYTEGDLCLKTLAEEARSSVIELVVTASDGSKNSSMNRTFVVDNIAPIDLAGGKLETQISGGSREPESSDPTKDRGGHLRIKTANALLTGEVNDSGNGSGIKRLFFYFTQGTGDSEELFTVRDLGDGMPKYNEGIEMPNNSLLVYDKDDTLTTINVPFNLKDSDFDPKDSNSAYIVVDSAEAYQDAVSNVTNGDGDGFEENLRIDGQWGVRFDSTKLEDGVYTINYLIEDNSGNMRYYTDTMLVQNSAPEVVGIELTTGDITMTLTPDEFENNYFQVRGYNFGINVIATGDNGVLKYNLAGENTVNGELNKTVNGVIGTGDNVGYTVGSFDFNETDDFPTKTSGETTYTLQVTDSLADADGNNLNLQSGIISLKVMLSNEDDTPPNAYLSDLNAEIETQKPGTAGKLDRGGSLFNENGKITGHIEPRIEHIKGEQEVSGKVILRGTVSDNHSIREISLYINEVADPVTIFKFDTETNKIIIAPDATVTKLPSESLFDEVKYEWTYVWDTETITEVAKKDVVVKVIAKDASYSSTPVEYTNSETSYGQDTFAVVPYITSLSRDPATYKTVRTRLGYYALLQGETLIVEGFNLSNGTVKVSKDSTKATANYDYTFNLDTDGNAILPEDAKSGWVSVVVNGVESTNNDLLRENDRDHNKDGDIWTNDCYVYVWSGDKKDISTDDDNYVLSGGYLPTYASMTKNSEGHLYASFATQNELSVYSAKMGEAPKATGYTPQPSLYTDISVVGADSVYINYFANYSSVWGAGAWKDNPYMNGGILTYASSIPDADAKTASNGATDLLAYFGERLLHRQKFNQYSHVRNVATNLSTTEGTVDSMVHTVYYDTITKSIKYAGFRDNGEINHIDDGSLEIAWINIDGGIGYNDIGYKDSNFKYGYNNHHIESTYLRDGKDSEDTMIEDNYMNRATNIDTYIDTTFTTDNYVGIERTSATRPSSAIAVDNENYPVIAYITETGALRLAYANITTPYPLDATTSGGASKHTVKAKDAVDSWRVQEIVSADVDDDVSLKIDSAGTVHILYKKSGLETLCYLKSNGKNDDGSYKDFIESTITEENPQWFDITLDGTVPYVSYITSTNSLYGLRMAYLLPKDNDNGVLIDTWEYMTVPLTYKPQNDRTHIETDVKFGNSDNKMKVAIGFSDGDAFRVTYLVD